MKINRIKNSNYKLLKFQLLKSYKNKKVKHSKIIQTQFELKKISNLVYKYHIENKKILFVGFPIFFEQILQKTKHILIPNFVWIDGMLTNNATLKKKMTNKGEGTKRNFRIPLQLKQKLDLIIVCNVNIVKEALVIQIPTIIFNKDTKQSTKKFDYEFSANNNNLNEKIKTNNFIYKFMIATLKRAESAKKDKTYKNLYSLKNLYKKKKAKTNIIKPKI